MLAKPEGSMRLNPPRPDLLVWKGRRRKMGSSKLYNAHCSETTNRETTHYTILTSVYGNILDLYVFSSTKNDHEHWYHLQKLRLLRFTRQRVS